MPKKSPLNSNFYYERARQKFLKLTYNLKFQQKIAAIRRTYRIKDGGFGSEDEVKKWRPQFDYHLYTKQLISLRKKCPDFSSQYDEIFKQYLIYGDLIFEESNHDQVALFSIPQSGAKFFRQGNLRGDIQDEQYLIEVYPNTTETELMQAFNEFKEYLNWSDQKITEAKKLNTDLIRDLDIVKLSRKVYPREKILDFINSTYPQNKLKNFTELEDRRRKTEEQIEKLFTDS